MKFEDKVAQLRIKKHKGKETQEFLDDVIRMVKGEALEYILGEVLFCDAKIDLSLRPMIPRPETEHWVKEAMRQITEHRQTDNRQYTTEVHEKPSVFRVLDLFSGSGCVGLAVAKYFPHAEVDLVEYDPKLKEQIEISIKKNKLNPSRVHAITGDTWEGATGEYDYIFAVPPYVPKEMHDEVMQELHAEDPLSFFDKEDGYYYHTQVLSRAKEFLKTGGTLYLEFDITQREKIEELAQLHGYKNYSFLKDPYGHEYVIVIPNKPYK